MDESTELNRALSTMQPEDDTGTKHASMLSILELFGERAPTVRPTEELRARVRELADRCIVRMGEERPLVGQLALTCLQAGTLLGDLQICTLFERFCQKADPEVKKEHACLVRRNLEEMAAFFQVEPKKTACHLGGVPLSLSTGVRIREATRTNPPVRGVVLASLHILSIER